MAAQTAPQISTRFSATRRPRKINLLSDARDIEQLTLQRIRDCPNDALSLTGFAGLVRSFVALVDCIQRLRGIPTPGQLRPDLDPVQMARMLKRARARQPLDLISAGNGSAKFAVPDDEAAEPLQTKSLTAKAKDPLNKPPIPESESEHQNPSSKESLSPGQP